MRFGTSFLTKKHQNLSQNATPATEFRPCLHFAQRWQCDSQKMRNTTRLKCCACQAKWHRRCPKCCACQEKCNTSFENVAKVLCLPHKTTFDAFSYEFSFKETSKSTSRGGPPSIFITCHKMPRLPSNLNLVSTSRSADNAIRKKRATRHV